MIKNDEKRIRSGALLRFRYSGCNYGVEKWCHDAEIQSKYPIHLDLKKRDLIFVPLFAPSGFR